MLVAVRHNSRRRRRLAPLVQLNLESLESRCLLSASPGTGALTVVPALAGNETLDQAQFLGALSAEVAVTVEADPRDTVPKTDGQPQAGSTGKA